MKLDINQHIRYCLFLFDNCTVNGLGTFRIIESPPAKDHNGNFIKAEKYSIAFTAEHTEKPRLAYFISSKENCTEPEAESLIRKYAKNVSEEIALKNEVWFRELGMLIKKEGELRFVSHKFTAKDLKKQVAVETSQSHMDNNVKSKSEPILTHAGLQHSTSTSQNNNTELLVEEDDFQLEEVVERTAPALAAVTMTPTPTPLAKINEKLSVVETMAAATFIPSSPTPLQNTAENFITEKKAAFTDKLILSAKAKKQIAYAASFTGSLLLLYVVYTFIISGKKSGDNLQANLALPGNNSDKEKYGSTNFSAEDPNSGAEFTNKKNSTDLNISVTGTKPLVNDPKKDKKKDAAKQDVPVSVNNNYLSTENAGPSNIQPFTASISTESEVPKQKIDLPAENKQLEGNAAEKTTSSVAAANDKQNNSATTIVLSQAEFPGGKAKLANYLKRNLVYPESGLDDGKEGTTVVKINVDKNGNVKASEIVNSLGKDFDREIMKVVGRMPKWAPAKQNGESVESTLSFKVEFKYDNKSGQRK
jgi:TonB family protein